MPNSPRLLSGVLHVWIYSCNLVSRLSRPKFCICHPHEPLFWPLTWLCYYRNKDFEQFLASKMWYQDERNLCKNIFWSFLALQAKEPYISHIDRNCHQLMDPKKLLIREVFLQGRMLPPAKIGLMILSAFYFFPVDDVIAFVKFINVTYPLKTFKCKHFKHKLGLGS